MEKICFSSPMSDMISEMIIVTAADTIKPARHRLHINIRFITSLKADAAFFKSQS